MNDPVQVMQAMRMLLDRVRRETPHFYLQAAIPELKSFRGDRLAQLWNCQNDLLTQGKLVWGVLIQANGALMLPGDFHLPGEIACSPDPVFDAQPELLEEVASRIYELKNTQPHDPELRVVADHITNEMHRSFCERIPLQLTEGRVVVRYTVIFYRDHLPHRMLGPSRLVPILVHGRHSLAMILPGPLWSKELSDAWKPDSEFLDYIQQMQATERAERRDGPLVHVTRAAIESLRAIMVQQGNPKYVYLSFQGGSKSMMFANKKKPGDVETTIGDLRFLVEAETANKYWGLTIDYIHNGDKGGFRIQE